MIDGSEIAYMAEDGGSFDLCGECGNPIAVGVSTYHMEEYPEVAVRLTCTSDTCDFEIPLTAQLTEDEIRRTVSLNGRK